MRIQVTSYIYNALWAIHEHITHSLCNNNNNNNKKYVLRVSVAVEQLDLLPSNKRTHNLCNFSLNRNEKSRLKCMKWQYDCFHACEIKHTVHLYATHCFARRKCECMCVFVRAYKFVCFQILFIFFCFSRYVTTIRTKKKEMVNYKIVV